MEIDTNGKPRALNNKSLIRGPLASRLSRLFKRCTPNAAIQGAKTIIEALDPLCIHLYRNRHRFHRPIPPMHLRARVGNRWIRPFIESGANCASSLENALLKFTGKRIADYQRVLDFGCGCGRTLQHLFFAGSDSSRYYGCDVDKFAIRWMQDNYDLSRFVVNDFNPPLPFQEARFDLVYSLSIFTHLNEAEQLCWLGEIRRVLRPGGVALITIQGQRALDNFLADKLPLSSLMLGELRSHSHLQEQEFIFVPYEDFTPDAGRFPGIHEEYGLTFQSESYIKRRWREQFEIMGLELGTVDNLQDLVVLKKH